MKRMLSATLSLLLASGVSLGQVPKCELPISASPSNRGLRLGMTTAELRKWLGITKQNKRIFKKAYRELYISKGYHFLSFQVSRIPLPIFEGWSELQIDPTDHVIAYKIYYPNDIWPLEDFLDRTIEQFHLPDRSKWGLVRDFAWLNCSDFSVELMMHTQRGLLSLRLADADRNQKEFIYRRRIQKGFSL